MMVSFYEDDDVEVFYACLGQMGFEGMLKTRGPITIRSVWEWIPRGSEHWDAVHQKIYRNYRATKLDAAQAGRLPSLPDPTSEPAPEAELEDAASSLYRALANFLQVQTAHTAEFFAVLGEDTYESSFGDGEFHYFKHLARTEEDAKRYIAAAAAAPDAGYSKCHLRRLQVTLDGDRIRGVIERQVFDHCKLAEVLAAADGWANEHQAAR